MITWNIDPTNYTHEQLNELALVVADMDDSIAKQLYDAMGPKYYWVCNECGSKQYTGSVSEQDIQSLQCGYCGNDEFTKIKS